VIWAGAADGFFSAAMAIMAPMKILLSNDDGYQAPGLIALAAALEAVAQVDVVAPDRNRSGASNSLTLESPIRAHTAENGFVFVDGTPTDCVHLAITGLLDYEPDMVIAGINAGANMGDDVLYSGTVAAAMEGRFLGLPAIAVSLANAEANSGAGEEFKHFDTAAQVVVSLLQRLKSDPLPVDTILNVNVPDVAHVNLEGFEVTRLGRRHKSEPVVKMQDQRGKDVYWVGPVGGEQDASEGTDFHAVRQNRVSLTPLNVDLTRYAAMEQISGWVEGL